MWSKNDGADSIANSKCLICKNYISWSIGGASINFIDRARPYETRVFICKKCMEEFIGHWNADIDYYNQCHFCEEPVYGVSVSGPFYSIRVQNKDFVSFLFHKECFKNNAPEELIFNE